MSIFRAILVSSLIVAAGAIFTTPSLSQEESPIRSTGSFDYFSCISKLSNETIEQYYTGIAAVVNIYNNQPKVGTRMAIPKVNECYISIGKPGSFLAGFTTITYYPDRSYFECSVAENCTGIKAGYMADISIVRGNTQMIASTRESNDAVYMCLYTKEVEIKQGNCP